MNNFEIKKQAKKGFVWRFAQYFIRSFLALVLQIVIARMVTPAEYGLVALAAVFITIANVFIQTSFSSAIIQKDKLNDNTLSTVFWVGIGGSILLYIIIYVLSPYVSAFYKMPQLAMVLKIQSISLIFAGLCSVHVALIDRDLLFKRSFYIGLFSSLAQGVVGIAMAIRGYGVWALVYSSLAANLIICIMSWRLYSWKPAFIYDISGVYVLFAFSGRVLVCNLLNTVFNNMRSLVIGKVYIPADLGYYNRGMQFPSAIMTNVDGAIASVLFPTLSKFQKDPATLLSILRKTLQISLFICVPLMFGLALVAEPLVLILLTKKWLGCVPFIKLSAFICVLWPFSAITHAINAIGRSDIALKVNIVSKISATLTMIYFMQFNIYYFVVSSLYVSVILLAYTAFLAKKYLSYPYKTQILDVYPPFLFTLVIYFLLQKLPIDSWSNWGIIVTKLTLASFLYLTLSKIFHVSAYSYLEILLIKQVKLGPSGRRL